RSRAVRPELGDDALIVGAIDEVGRVRRTRGRVDRVARAIVGAERVVEHRPGGDIDEHALRRVDAAAQPDQLHHRVLHDRVARAAGESPSVVVMVLSYPSASIWVSNAACEIASFGWHGLRSMSR